MTEYSVPGPLRKFRFIALTYPEVPWLAWERSALGRLEPIVFTIEFNSDNARAATMTNTGSFQIIPGMRCEEFDDLPEADQPAEVEPLVEEYELPNEVGWLGTLVVPLALV